MAKIPMKYFRRRRVAALTVLLLLIFLVALLIRCTTDLVRTATASGGSASAEVPETTADTNGATTTADTTADTPALTTTGTTAPATTGTTATTVSAASYSIPQASLAETSFELSVTPILQNPELPTGCEVTSLTMALQYAGFNVDKLTMADDYLIRADPFTTTFGEAFVGSPYDATAWGCYAPVIEATGNLYLDDVGSDMAALDITGSDFETLLGCVSAGTPVITWVSINLTSNIIEQYYWTTPDGEDAVFLINEHCVLLCGYDLSANTVSVCDPLEGWISYNMDTFRDRYETMYSQAVILVSPDETN